jgi:hypothetical protein
VGGGEQRLAVLGPADAAEMGLDLGREHAERAVYEAHRAVGMSAGAATRDLRR